jgi:hypothetical protein
MRTFLVLPLLVMALACEYSYAPPTEGTYAAQYHVEAPWSTAQSEFTKELESCGEADNLADGVQVKITSAAAPRQYVLRLAYSSQEFPETDYLEFLVRHDEKDGEVIGESFMALASNGQIEGRIEGIVHDTFGHIQVARRIARSDGACGDQYNFTW